MGAEVDTGREAVEALAKRLKAIDWRDGCLMERACATLRALLARAETAELRAAEAVVALNNRDRERMQAEREARNAEAQRDAAIAERDQARTALRQIRQEIGRARGERAHHDASRSAFRIACAALAQEAPKP